MKLDDDVHITMLIGAVCRVGAYVLRVMCLSSDMGKYLLAANGISRSRWVEGHVRLISC